MARKGGLTIRVIIVVVLAAAAVWYFLPESEGDSRLHVILISIDTCRADHLGSYNPHSKLTPNIDRFAESATVFESCVSPVPLTLPSHTTMLTGRIPPAHGAHQNAVRIGSAEVTLAEILGEGGYATAAIVSHLVLSRPFGLDQGFETYADKMGRSGAVEGERRGEATSALATGWLQRRDPEQPSFLFVHYFDPHEPYLAPGKFAKQQSPDQAGQYAAEIAYVDACIGQLLDELKRMDIYDSSLIVRTGDHGEMLGDHGELDHGYFIYESAIKVPLIVKLPGQEDGRRIAGVVGLVDILPTVCSVVGVEPPEDIQGRDLAPLMRGESTPDEDRLLYCESLLPKTNYNARPLLGLVGARWKYIHSTRPELYDLVADAAEANNLADAQPRRVRALAEELQAVFAEFAGSESGDQAALDPRTLELLASVGYVGLERKVDVGLDAIGDDAKDLIGFHNRFHHDLRALRNEMKTDEAIALCRELIEQRPEAVECHSVLASVLNTAGRVDEAIDVYTAAIELSPDDPFLRVARGRLIMALGRPAEAAEDFREASKLNPTDINTLVALGQALRQAGSYDQAANAYRSALEIDPEAVAALGNLAYLYLDAPEKALLPARQLLDLRPNDPRTQETYGWVLARGEDFEGGLVYLQKAVEESATATACYRLGWTLEHLDRSADALAMYETAARLPGGRIDDALRTDIAAAIRRLKNP